MKAYCVTWHQKHGAVAHMTVVSAEDEDEAVELADLDTEPGDPVCTVVDVRELTWAFTGACVPWGLRALLKAVLRVQKGEVAIAGYDDVLLAVAEKRSRMAR